MQATATAKADPATTTSRVADAIGFSSTKAHARANGRYSKLSQACEKAGLLVVRSSIVGVSGRRRLDSREFRGFTLIEGNYGLIFVNTDDDPSAQLFSLAHELGHVMLGAPGVSWVGARRGSMV